jgi:hypothetical protein
MCYEHDAGTAYRQTGRKEDRRMAQPIQARSQQLLQQLQALLASVEQRLVERGTHLPEEPGAGAAPDPQRPALTQRLQALRTAPLQAEQMVHSAEAELDELDAALRELLDMAAATPAP